MSSSEFLNDVAPEKAFWMHNGVICRNIYELVNAIKSQDLFSFTYHVNFDKSKNDYAKWIDEVLGDSVLAKKLKNIYNKELYADIIHQRIREMENFYS